MVAARIKGIMCAQAALVEERLPSRQEDFYGSLFSANGDGVKLPPGQEHVASDVLTASEGGFVAEVGVESVGPVTLEGALVISGPSGDSRMPMVITTEHLPDGNPMLSFSDHAGTLRIRRVAEKSTVNVDFQYVGKPLAATLSSARFFEALVTVPGLLYLEVLEPAEEGPPIPHRIALVDLPLSVPETNLEAHRNRLRALEAFYEIQSDMGVEIRYPAANEDEESLSNLNFVLKAIRGGWVALPVTSFLTPMPAATVRSLLDELRGNNEVFRAFRFELSNERYRLFGSEVSLGPSRRYVPAARLETDARTMERWLRGEPKDTDTLSIAWEPLDQAPMHVFFEDLPRSDIRAVDRQLTEFEMAYGVRSQHFGRAWENGEGWARDVLDGKRWYSLVEAREELTRENPV